MGANMIEQEFDVSKENVLAHVKAAKSYSGRSIEIVTSRIPVLVAPYSLQRRDWAFQGDKPDYDFLCYLTETQAIELYLLNFCYNSELEAIIKEKTSGNKRRNKRSEYKYRKSGEGVGLHVTNRRRKK